MLSEKINQQISQGREERYKREYDPTPDWQDVTERMALLSIPQNSHERADDIVNNFGARGLDIEMLTQAVHQVLVPHVETMPTDYQMYVEGANGAHRKELARPDERSQLYEQAARLIKELGDLRDDEHEDSFLERASNVIALAIVLAHPYANGNGRTARLIGGLLREGPQSEDLMVLGKERPESGFRISSYIPRDDTASALEILQAAAALDTPLEEEQAYRDTSRRMFATPYNM